MGRTLETRVDRIEEKLAEQGSRQDFLEGENHRNWGMVNACDQKIDASNEGISYIRGKLDEWDKRFLYRMESVEEDLDGTKSEVKKQKEFCQTQQIENASTRAIFSTKQKVIYGALVTLVATLASILIKQFVGG